MSLEQLCQEIEHRAQHQASAIIREAQGDGEKILAQAEASAGKTVRSARAEAERFGEGEATERIAAARLEEQKMLSDAKEEAVRANLEFVWAKYCAHAKKRGYAKKLKDWAHAALSELGGSGVLRTNSYGRAILSGSGMRVSAKDLECSGGVRAETHDGRIIVDYTFESQFERKKEEISREIYARLFPEADENAALGTGISAAGKKTGKRHGKKIKSGKKAKRR